VDELLEQFLIEGRELVQQASDGLLALEQKPSDAALIDSVFRAIHTLKGSVVLFDFTPMTLILHCAEDILGDVRRGQLAVAPDVIDTLHVVIEHIGHWLAAIAETGVLPEDAAHVAEQLVATLSAAGSIDGEGSLQAQRPAAQVPPESAAWVQALIAKWLSDETAAAEKAAQNRDMVIVRYTPDQASFFNGYDPIEIVKAVPALVFLHLSQREKPVAEVYNPFECTLIIELISSASLDEVKAAFRFVASEAEILQLAAASTDAALSDSEAATPGTVGRSDFVSRTLRVDIARIERLADLVDELVIAKNDMAELAAQAAAGLDPRAVMQAFISRQAGLDRAVGQLHRAVSSVRLVPFAPLIRRFSGIVRELARSLGKEVDLQIEAQDVEADKAIVDGLADPLIHLVRNALDHGFEPTEQRQKAGKPRRATLRLAVSCQGNQALVEVQDDGRGIDPALIRQLSGERGLMSREALAALSDADVLDLIFMPGFSTAGTVTDISGRGVGMDAVRASVGRLGGKVSIESRVGTGTTVRLTLPLTIALTRMVVVSCAGERYGVPMEAIVETTKIASEQIVPVRAGRATILRGRTVPFIELASLLGIAHEKQLQREQKALVVHCGPDLVAIGVDAFLDCTELLLRPLTGILSGMRGIAGTALLGNGQVMMVLELAELIG
jgi:two-component system chemotaxis sensor kinase CheA